LQHSRNMAFTSFTGPAVYHELFSILVSQPIKNTNNTITAIN
jgi:hypothetical protein